LTRVTIVFFTPVLDLWNILCLERNNTQTKKLDPRIII